MGNLVFGVANEGSLSGAGARHSGVSVAFDGVLFERTQLLAGLSQAIPPTGMDDASIIALAYERWGEAFPAHIDGEFAFALWDSFAAKLVLGRDVVGRRGLYYGSAAGATVFCSELRGMFAFPSFPAEPDDESVVRFMALRPEEGRTLFRNIFYAPAAHVVVLQKGKSERLVKVWRPDEQPLLRVRDPRDHAEALRAALLRAVEVRLPAHGIVASQLSSGYDSSGVTALAAQALARQNRPLLAYTSVPSHPSDASAVMQGWFSDEWPLAHQVAEMYPNIEHIRIPTGSAPWMPTIDALTEIYGAPPYFIRNAAWMWALQRDAQSRGAKVMFNGQIGNLTSSYDGGNSLFDLRKRRDWGGLARAIRSRRRRGATWRGLLARTWMPPAATRSAIRRLIGKKQKPFYEYSLVRPEFYRSTQFEELSASPLGDPVVGDRRNSAAWRLSIMRKIDFGAVANGERRLFDLQRADPTSDRGVIELCLSLPDEAFLMGNQPRDLYRYAMRDVLPPDLLRETGGGLQSSDFLENFGERIGEFQQEMELLQRSPAAQRVLDLERMQAMLASWPTDLGNGRGTLDQKYNYTFGGAIAMGRFLRRLEQGELFPAETTQP